MTIPKLNKDKSSKAKATHSIWIQQGIAADEQTQNLRRNGVRSDIVTSAYKGEHRDSFIVA